MTAITGDREARRWLEIKAEFLRNHCTVTRREMVTLTRGETTGHTSGLPEWLRNGYVLGIRGGRAVRYPLFQIDTHRRLPWPEFQESLTVLREQLSEWQIAIWFTSPNAWVGDWRMPIDLLGKDGSRIIEAARREVAYHVY